MKWIILAGSVVLMAGCCCPPTDVAYKKVVTYKPVVTYQRVSTCGAVVACKPVVISPVVQPVLIHPYMDGPWDVTTTTIDFY